MTSVSVIIPAYQSASTIVDAITSVLNQLKGDVEIIVVDDGSTDNISEVLQPLMDRITFLRQKNQGSAVARNLGIKNSSGELIAFLDADDLWLPEKLTLQLPLFEKNTRVGLVFGNMKYLSEGNILSKTHFDLLHPSRGNIFLDLFKYNYVPTSTVMIRRQVFQQIGMFDASFRIAQDYHLWLRVAARWEFDYVQTPVTIYRMSSQQISRNLVRAATMLLQVKEDIYNSHIELFEAVDKSILERGLYNKYLKLIICYMREARKEEANQVLKRYRQARGITIFYFVFHTILKLPGQMMVKIILLWDKLRQKPEYGIY